MYLLVTSTTCSMAGPAPHQPACWQAPMCSEGRLSLAVTAAHLFSTLRESQAADLASVCLKAHLSALPKLCWKCSPMTGIWSSSLLPKSSRESEELGSHCRCASVTAPAQPLPSPKTFPKSRHLKEAEQVPEWSSLLGPCWDPKWSSGQNVLGDGGQTTREEGGLSEE